MGRRLICLRVSATDSGRPTNCYPGAPNRPLYTLIISSIIPERGQLSRHLSWPPTEERTSREHPTASSLTNAPALEGKSISVVILRSNYAYLFRALFQPRTHLFGTDSRCSDFTARANTASRDAIVDTQFPRRKSAPQGQGGECRFKTIER